jgi:hypothetical protein
MEELGKLTPEKAGQIAVSLVSSHCVSVVHRMNDDLMRDLGEDGVDVPTASEEIKQ